MRQWTFSDYLLAFGACLAIFFLKAPLWVVLPGGALFSLALRRWGGRP